MTDNGLKMKALALCDCLSHNYHMVDSSNRHFPKDYSESAIFQSMSYGDVEVLSEYTKKNTSEYYKKRDVFVDTSGNHIFYQCLLFYQSKELDKFIKKEMKREKTLRRKK